MYILNVLILREFHSTHCLLWLEAAPQLAPMVHRVTAIASVEGRGSYWLHLREAGSWGEIDGGWLA